MCFKYSKAFSILVAVVFAFSLLSVTASATMYEEDENWLLDTAGVYGGHFIYIRCYDLLNAIDYEDLVIWIPENYVDYFSSDDNALVNISGSQLSLRGYDFDHGVHTLRAPAYSYLQIRTDTSPYTYYNLEYMEVLDTNIQIQGENSPFYNGNLHWDYNTMMICVFIGFQTIVFVIVGVIHDKRYS